MTSERKHKHNFKTQYSTGTGKGSFVHLKCVCGATSTRKGTPEEIKEFREKEKDAKSIHLVWNDFLKRFANKPIQIPATFRWSGYALMQKVSKWAEKYPEDVRICGVDDAVHSTSGLVLIEHRSEKMYMGTSVVVIPQCTGEQPLVYFMYPRALVGIMDTLKDIRKVQKKYPNDL